MTNLFHSSRNRLLAGTFLLSASFLSVLVAPGCNSGEKPQQIKTEQASLPKADEPIIAPAVPPSNFKSETANVNGVNIHYVIGGTGEPLVLVHGFGQNWYMWNRLLPELSKHFTVIAPDLRGIGESGKPTSGYDKKTMATDIHELVKKLGYKNINLVGHDIGLMVSYAYAAQYGSEVKKIALLDAPLPGVDPMWKQVSSTAWHFGFFSRPIAGELVEGQAGLFLNDFWPQQFGTNKHPFYKEETDEFVRAYSVKGAVTGAFHWFAAFPQDATDNRQFMKHKLQMPLLALAGEYSAAPFLASQLRLVADHVTAVTITGSGHWLVQEQTEQVLNNLMKFFTDK